MVQSHGSNADVIGNGYVLSSFLNSATWSGNVDAGETTTFKKKSKTYIPGLRDATMSCEGLFDGDLDAVDQVMEAAFQAGAGLFTYFPWSADVAGRPGYTIDATESSYEVNTEVGDVAQISAEFQTGDKGVIGRGKVVSPWGVRGAPGNSANLDGGAASVNGGALVLHTAVSAALVVKIQDSADGATFADLPGSLTVANGRASLRLAYAGTIRRYVRALWTGTGTFVAVFERN